VVPEAIVVLRAAADGWADRAGEYTDGAWQFVLDERDFGGGLEFKFVVLPGTWMDGPNITAPAPAADSQLTYTDDEVKFSQDIHAALVTENGVVAQRLINRNLNGTDVYDVIVSAQEWAAGYWPVLWPTPALTCSCSKPARTCSPPTSATCPAGCSSASSKSMSGHCGSTSR
jgi:hypothetical protein